MGQTPRTMVRGIVQTRESCIQINQTQTRKKTRPHQTSLYTFQGTLQNPESKTTIRSPRHPQVRANQILEHAETNWHEPTGSTTGPIYTIKQEHFLWQRYHTRLLHTTHQPIPAPHLHIRTHHNPRTQVQGIEKQRPKQDATAIIKIPRGPRNSLPGIIPKCQCHRLRTTRILANSQNCPSVQKQGRYHTPRELSQHRHTSPTSQSIHGHHQRETYHHCQPSQPPCTHASRIPRAPHHCRIGADPPDDHTTQFEDQVKIGHGLYRPKTCIRLHKPRKTMVSDGGAT